jgi:hypothetical protein
VKKKLLLLLFVCWLLGTVIHNALASEGVGDLRPVVAGPMVSVSQPPTFKR